jgi:Asp/Glu/hydantoin racemase
MSKIGVLHTSLVFISVDPVITELLAETAPDAEIAHFVDSDVLATVIDEGGVSDSSAERMVHLAKGAEAAGVDIILSACSSLGPGVDVAAAQVGVPVVKIDSAMATEAVRRAGRIGVLGTVPTTLGPTAALIQEKARDTGRTVEVETKLAEGAFDILMGGDREEHDRRVRAAATELAERVELIVLAQASMWRMVPALEEATGLPVLSSPQAGVRDAVEQLAAAGAA